MNIDSKLTLSDEEQQLVHNTHWILTKRVIIEKAGALLGTLSEAFKTQVANSKQSLPLAVLHTTPKIARGENYRQLPYVLLDYPRQFTGPDIFAVRTMFWWGNFFSITLLISGVYKDMFAQQLLKNLIVNDAGYFICINKSQWHHHFEDDNMVPVKARSEQEIRDIIEQKEFIKIAIKFPLHQWNEANILLEESFKKIIGLLNT
ncbi:MAG: hypothetical protein IPL84_09165 [Chitinophagaceae bacterium]|nr:hypothetical protein [Chitinophagaceae bacterium]